MASRTRRTAGQRPDETGEVTMFATIKSLIPEPRQVDQPRRYVGRHRGPEALDPAPVDGAAADGAGTAIDTITVDDADPSGADEVRTVGADAGPADRTA
jgi:hypothetical protein